MYEYTLYGVDSEGYLEYIDEGNFTSLMTMATFLSSSPTTHFKNKSSFLIKRNEGE